MPKLIAKSDSKPSRPSSHRWLILVAGFLTLIVALLWVGRPTQAPSAAIDTSAVELDPALRTVVVAVNEDDIPSQPGGALRASLTAGRLPTSVQVATVLSDTNCTPDAEGISHCNNVMMVGQHQLTVRHNHRMSEVPCLSPGEEVNLVPLALLQRQ